jgi:type I restriction enzyme S subunit
MTNTILEKHTNDWQIKKLGEICNFVGGGTPSKAVSSYWNGNIPWASIKDIKGQYLTKTSDSITDEGLKKSASNLANPNEIILATRINPGRPIITKIQTSINQDLKIVRPKVEIDNSFLFYLFLNIENDIIKLSNGTTVLGITLNSLNDIKIQLPSIHNQKAIVSKIEELFSELDKGIEDLKTAQLQLKTYRQSVLKWAFEGKLTEEWRRKKDKLSSVVELLHNIKNDKLKLKTKPLSPITSDELAELFEIPNEWRWVRNEEYLFEVKDGTHDTPKYLNEGIPFITQKNIKEDGLNFNNVQYISIEDHDNYYQRSNVSKGDILISMIGHYRGMTAIVENDTVFSIKNVGLFKFNNKYQYNKFSYYFYNSKVGLNIILKKSKGGAQPFIGLTELRNWPIIVCSLEEQHLVVQEIESRLSVADKMEESIAQSLQQAEALRQSILKKAFSGELV